MNSISLTIGVPVFNEARYLAKTIDSLCKQTYEDIEILISENCSQDDSYSIAEDFARSDRRIKLVRQKVKLSAEDNFRYLLNSTETDYFAWLGGHDVLNPKALEEIIKVFKTNENIICVYPRAAYLENNEFSEVEMSDRIDTLNMNVSERFKCIISNLNYGNAVYGVYKTEVLKKSFLDVNGGDLSILLKASCYGYIVPTSHIRSYFRVVRGNETAEDEEARYLRIGFKPNWREIHSMYPYQIASELKEINYFSKIKLLSAVRILMFRYRSYSWKPIFLYFIRNGKYQVGVNAIVCKIYDWVKGVRSPDFEPAKI